MKWKKVTIFISSTFNDMHAERDYLVKDVFPELREWCEERKIHLVDVDLRWGVTEEDSSSNHTVLACLNNIDESRPFFLCFLCQRRGWVPKDVSPETLDEYPDILAVIGRNSVTEMEIEHALLSPMKHIVNGNEKQEIPVDHALFYFRNPDYLEGLTPAQRRIFTNEGEEYPDLADSELEIFKKKIRDHWDDSVDYDCKWDTSILSPELPENVNQGRLTDFNVAGKPLKGIIIEQLKDEIKKEFPDRKDEIVYSSDLERDLAQQALFIELNCEGFISRAGDFDDLNDYAANDKDGLFVLSASAGYGKSMLLANFIIKESKKHNARFFNKFCGVSDLCSQQYSLWKTIFDEANIKCPDTLKDLKDNINDLLKELAKEKTVLIIDAINQLPDGLDMLEWLPKQLPENLKIILSVKEDENDTELTAGIEKLKENENISDSTVKPFKDKEEKKKLIKDYLKKYLKALDDQQIDTICDFDGSKNPLYLKILLSELRIFGSFDQLSKEIQQFGETPKEAFNTVLNRLENDINSLNVNSKKFTPLLFGLLANTRNGLSEEELVACMQKELGIDKEKLIQSIRLFIRQVRPFMARREGRTDYFYEAFKLAAKERYINNKIHYNKILADYFKEQADLENNLSFKGKNIRDFNELPYHLKESENTSSLEKILSTYRWIKNKSELSDIYNTINDYNYIDVENEDNYHVKLIRDTLVMSSHVLKENIKDNLPSQLWGRLKDIDNSKIKKLLIEIEKYTDYPWLKPRHHMSTPKDALKVTLTGHKDGVNSVCFSPDGKYIASGAKDHSIRVWDWKRQKEIAKLDGHTDSVSSVCFSPDGQYIASGSGDIRYNGNKDWAVRVWDWKAQKEIAKLDGHTDGVNCVYFSPDGQFIASGSKDNTVRVWDWSKQKEIERFNDRKFGINVRGLCFSPDGQFIASASMDNSVYVCDWKSSWSTTSRTGNEFFGGNGNDQTSVCFSPDGQYVVSGSEDKIVHVWNWGKQKKLIASGLEKRAYVGGSWKWDSEDKEIKLAGHKGVVNSVCFSSDGRYVVSGADDRSIRVWDWGKQKEIVKLEGHTNNVNGVCFSPDGRYVASGSNDKSIRVWEWKSAEETAGLTSHSETVNTVCFSSDGRSVVSGSYDKSVRVWDAETLKEICKFEGHMNSVNSVSFSPCGKYIASGSGEYTGYMARTKHSDKSVRVWDMREQKEIARSTRRHAYEYVKSVYFSPDGKYVVSGEAQHNSVVVWDWRKENDIIKLDGHTNTVNTVCFSPDGKYIASGSGDMTTGDLDFSIRIWDIVSQTEIARFDGHTYPVVSVCFSPDGRYVASGSGNRGIKWYHGGKESILVWDLESKKEITRLDTHTSGVNDVRFSSDGKYIISGAEDGTVCVWDWKKQKQVLLLNIEDALHSCMISKNNLQIVAGGSSGKILIYDIENLSTGITIVTAICDLDNHLSVRCSYCGKDFDILEDKLGNIVNCLYCKEELQVNDFTANPIESIGVENNDSIKNEK